MKFMNKLEQLEAAYKKENSKVAVRMLAVLMVLKDDKDVQYTAQTLHRCTNWVRNWVDRFKVDGLDGLYDQPKERKTMCNPKEANEFYYVQNYVDTIYTCNATTDNI